MELVLCRSLRLTLTMPVHAYACSCSWAPVPPVYVHTCIHSHCCHMSVHTLSSQSPSGSLTHPWPLVDPCSPSYSTLPSPALHATSLPILLLCYLPTPPSHKCTATWPWPSLPLMPSHSPAHIPLPACSHPFAMPPFSCTLHPVVCKNTHTHTHYTFVVTFNCSK